jgi:glutamate-1-semialdehyde 2,1-aminomutase
MDLDRLTTRAAEIAERESADLLTKTTASKALYERAVKSLPSGVASNFQVGDPYPVYLEKGRGSSVWDVDGTEYKDFHGGFGVNIVGHAHPKIVEALEKAAHEAIHFAVTTPTTVALAEAICERFELEQVRIVNSGTEATMDALRVARAATGRDKVVKMEGSYHGHHDSLLFSVVPEADVLGVRHDVEHVG